MRDCGQLVFAWRETLNAAPTTIEPANGLRLATRLSAGMAEPLTVEVVPGGLLARFAIEVT
ncbi:hypothetical protein AB433_06315 [Croceicoccus naphthovorans]|uniref:Uncharacterized protein n=1 Tax=Croceicoccus naphthovorans TaxID=1348774 RepID=A0A0G3XH51_9SPHN|nr:hypothetical protein AB433_06315 [Croceicoccus naphthovorans]